MDDLLAAYGTVEEEKTDTSLKVNNDTKGRKKSSGVVRVTLPVSKKTFFEEEDTKLDKNEDLITSVPTTGVKRSIADILPQPKAKQQKTFHKEEKLEEKPQRTKVIEPIKIKPSLPPVTKSKSPFQKKQEATSENNEKKTEEMQDTVGPQMPCAADLVYYETYYNQPYEYDNQPDTVSEMANCSNIPEVCNFTSSC